MKHLKTIIIVILVITNIIYMLYAFDKHTAAEQYKMEAESNLREASKYKQLADSASVMTKIQADSAMVQRVRANVIQKSYDSLLRVCK